MILAGMIALDENALICDLAETYHIYDYRSLPARLVATFSVGLRKEARIWEKISGNRLTCTETLLARIYDRMTEYIWAVFGSKEDPPQIYPVLSGMEDLKEEENSEFKSFETSEGFDSIRARIIEGER